MGQAATIGLGLALAQPEKRVLVVTGDGEMLMGLGALATVADQAPRNLAILVMDNELYAETGRQPTATAGPTDLAKVAEGAGFRAAMTIASPGEFETAKDILLGGDGPVLVVAKVAVRSYGAPAEPQTRDGAWQVNRFRVDLLGEYDAMIGID
jgi:thiamine pyrophosphate-dependent acetolactate synthase large subunit-like protein